MAEIKDAYLLLDHNMREIFESITIELFKDVIFPFHVKQ